MIKTAHEHLIDYALEKNLDIQVFDGEAESSFLSDKNEILMAVNGVEASTLTLYSKSRDVVAAAEIMLEYGQEPAETIYDYSANQFMDDWYEAYEAHVQKNSWQGLMEADSTLQDYEARHQLNETTEEDYYQLAADTYINGNFTECADYAVKAVMVSSGKDAVITDATVDSVVDQINARGQTVKMSTIIALKEKMAGILGENIGQADNALEDLERRMSLDSSDPHYISPRQVRDMVNTVENTISHVWGVDDVQEAAKELNLGIALSDQHCKDILAMIDRNTDSTIGVNWDVIKANIEMYVEDNLQSSPK